MSLVRARPRPPRGRLSSLNESVDSDMTLIDPPSPKLMAARASSRAPGPDGYHLRLKLPIGVFNHIARPSRLYCRHNHINLKLTSSYRHAAGAKFCQPSVRVAADRSASQDPGCGPFRQAAGRPGPSGGGLGLRLGTRLSRDSGLAGGTRVGRAVPVGGKPSRKAGPAAAATCRRCLLSKPPHSRLLGQCQRSAAADRVGGGSGSHNYY